MTLTYFEITSEFRNLKGLKLTLENEGLRKNNPDNDTHVIIGNNGAGKTNILEALSSVFSVLLNHSQDFKFGFVLRYEIDDVKYRIVYNDARHTVSYQKNKIEVPENEMQYPSRIICNYSGEDPRMWENYYKASFDAYMSSVRNADIPTELPMVYIEKSMWQIILLCMLQKRQEVDAFDQFLTEKLGIGPEGVDEVCLTLNRDVWDRWETENQITLYIRQIQKRMGGGIQLTSSDVNQFNPSDDLPRALFYKLLGATAVIDRLKITYNHGIDSMLLSEGEKKMMVVLFILEALADERTLVLMDEPDSHIHISRKAELCEMFHKMDHRASIITSHSPTLTAAFEQEYRRSIIMLTKEQNGKVKMIDNDVVNMVETLTDGIWTSQQQNLFLNSTDDIILVEGKSDGLFIGTALKHFQQKGLYPGLHFTFVPCGGASGVKLFMDKFRPKNGQMIMAFFDGDDAGKNGMTEIIKGKRKKDKNKGEIGSSKKSVKVGHTWVSLYPPYKNRRDTVAFNVEDYLSYKLFRKIIFRFTSLATIKSKETVKSDMSSACEKDEIKVEYYKNFATLFNNILAIKQADADGKKEVDWVW